MIILPGGERKIFRPRGNTVINAEVDQSFISRAMDAKSGPAYPPATKLSEMCRMGCPLFVCDDSKSRSSTLLKRYGENPLVGSTVVKASFNGLTLKQAAEHMHFVGLAQVPSRVSDITRHPMVSVVTDGLFPILNTGPKPLKTGDYFRFMMPHIKDFGKRQVPIYEAHNSVAVGEQEMLARTYDDNPEIVPGAFQGEPVKVDPFDFVTAMGQITGLAPEWEKQPTPFADTLCGSVIQRDETKHRDYADVTVTQAKCTAVETELDKSMADHKCLARETMGFRRMLRGLAIATSTNGLMAFNPYKSPRERDVFGMDPLKPSLDQPLPTSADLALRCYADSTIPARSAATGLLGYTMFVMDCVAQMLQESVGQVHGRVVYGGKTGENVYVEVNPRQPPV